MITTNLKSVMSTLIYKLLNQKQKPNVKLDLYYIVIVIQKSITNTRVHFVIPKPYSLDANRTRAPQTF